MLHDDNTPRRRLELRRRFRSNPGRRRLMLTVLWLWRRAVFGTDVPYRMYKTCTRNVYSLFFFSCILFGTEYM